MEGRSTWLWRGVVLVAVVGLIAWATVLTVWIGRVDDRIGSGDSQLSTRLAAIEETVASADAPTISEVNALRQRIEKAEETLTAWDECLPELQAELNSLVVTDYGAAVSNQQLSRRCTRLFYEFTGD